MITVVLTDYSLNNSQVYALDCVASNTQSSMSQINLQSSPIVLGSGMRLRVNRRLHVPTTTCINQIERTLCSKYQHWGCIEQAATPMSDIRLQTGDVAATRSL
jgi:hypothetical protein